jgi:hypothetical protein
MNTLHCSTPAGAICQSKVDLIDHIRAVIDHLLTHTQKEKGVEAVPYFQPTDLAALPVENQETLHRLEAQSYRANPEHCVIHFCLQSASELLEVSRVLMTQSPNPSPFERKRQWEALAASTKAAGRAAYRAALILVDPEAG